MVKKWNYAIEKDFFSSRGTIKNPGKQRRKRIVNEEGLKPGQAKRGNAYQHTRTGARLDLKGLVVRSSWEANFVRVLDLHKIKFEFEPQEFEFPPTSSGRRHIYIPDFYLPKTDEYVEVKGYLDGRGRNKLRKFKKYYKEEFDKLVVVISRSNKANKNFFAKLGVQKVLYYENIKDVYSEKIANWEGR